MKAPWTKATDRLEKVMHNTLVKFRQYVDAKFKEEHENRQKAILLQNRSEQFKHNDHKRRLAVLEEILKEEVAKAHEEILDREVRAAEDAEKQNL